MDNFPSKKYQKIMYENNLNIVENILHISIKLENFTYIFTLLEYNMVIELKKEFEDHLLRCLIKDPTSNGGSVKATAL